ncbi:MAG: aminotransferase [Deltaproteobacteria bacterium]|nr:MAG: aminotransferase [Deltaproteobacteria bacterium]
MTPSCLAPDSALTFSKRVTQIHVSATKEMPVLASRVGNCVSLGQGVPSFSAPVHIIDSVCRMLRENPSASKYSLQAGMTELRHHISETLLREKKIQVDPDKEVLVTVGAMEGLMAAILTVVDRGDEVILPSPTYASHIEQVLLAEGTPVFVPLRATDWGLEVDQIRNAVTEKTRAIILCNPGNPTGAVFDDADVFALCELAVEEGIIIISDETYDFMTYGIPMPVSPASLPRFRKQVISVFSFSKKYALTGWRVGYITACEQLMAQIMKAHDASAICAPTPSQYAALAALSGPQTCVKEMCRALTARKELCCRRLDQMAGIFDYVEPRGAFYVMARYLFTDRPSRDVAIQILNEAGVITIPGGSFGPQGEGHLRISFGGEEEELNEAFDRMEKWAGSIV